LGPRFNPAYLTPANTIGTLLNVSVKYPAVTK